MARCDWSILNTVFIFNVTFIYSRQATNAVFSVAAIPGAQYCLIYFNEFHTVRYLFKDPVPVQILSLGKVEQSDCYSVPVATLNLGKRWSGASLVVWTKQGIQRCDLGL